jgi:hypothetical protein
MRGGFMAFGLAERLDWIGEVVQGLRGFTEAEIKARRLNTLLQLQAGIKIRCLKTKSN